MTFFYFKRVFILLEKKICKIVYFLSGLLLPKNKIVLFSSSPYDKFGNIGALAEKCVEKKIPFIWLNLLYFQKHSIRFFIILAQAKILVVDAASPTARVKLNKNTIIIQCWHACGVYKKVGFDAKRKYCDEEEEKKRIERIHGNISWFICTSKESAKIYSKAFHLSLDRMLIFGSPRLDEIINNPPISQPKIYTILYAPTFRTRNKKNLRYSVPLLDANYLRKQLVSKIGLDICLAFRGHPTTPLPKNLVGWENWTDIPQNEALAKSSILITDYSSIFFDFLVFKRPIIFYIPDYEEYIITERELYFLPFKYFPDTTCVTQNDLILKLIKYYNKKVDYSLIYNKYMSACDGKSAERICQFIRKIFMEKK